MRNPLRFMTHAALLALAAISATVPAWAEKPDWAGNGKGGNETRHANEKRHEKDRNDARQEREHGGERMHSTRQPMVELRFSAGDRRFVHDYYSTQIRAGHCPPGLAKKNNGCMPPGQAKKWRMGYPLPADLRRYPLPPEVLIRLPLPPAGHEFVRVASDILLIAVGSAMVIDAIEDLGR